MKRDIFLPSIQTLLIFGMTLFLSCAHQNRADDVALTDETGTEEAAVAEAGEVQEGSSDLTDLAVNQDGETASTETKLEQPSEDLANLGSDSGLEKIEGSTAEALSTDPAAITPEAAPVTELDPLTNLGTEAAAETAAAAIPSTETTPAPDTQLQAEPSIAASAPVENSVPIIPMEPVISPVEEKPSFTRSARVHHASSGVSSVPKIPSKTVTRAGTKLNRFYFVRQGDTPSSVSTLIYGNAGHAHKLSQWNNSWKPGSLVYYLSPNDSRESKMRSFYQERNVQPDEYAVAQGDWLSKIAQKKLGASGSWKEIAVVNGMQTPDSLEVGQKIAIYPKDLGGYSNTVAEQPVPTPQEEPQQVEQPVAQNPEPMNAAPQAQPVDPNQELANQVPPPPQPQQPQVEPQQPQVVHQQPAVDANKVVEQNLPAVFILGGVLVLSILYLIVRRRRSAKPVDEFADDTFAPPTKLKRK